ncbi:MAG TPA: hypothetical protein VHQ39_12020, partial [Dongiaceae bacterium]|nr:hypothetical protein [Dongiaceae bacterium]
MTGLIACLDALERIKHPSDLTLRRDGKALAATISPATRESGQSYASRIWGFDLAGGSEQLTFGPASDALGRYSPLDGRLAFASDRALPGKMALYLLQGPATSAPRPLGDIPGTIEDIRWSADARSLIVLAADRGLDAAATSGAKRLAWGNDEDPAVTNPVDTRRRLYRVMVGDGKTMEIGPGDLTVWEFDLLGDHEAIAVVSSDASERGWYHAKLARIDFATRKAVILHEPEWQIMGAAVDPAGKRAAFLESWSSDRGLVAGEIRLMDLAGGKPATLAAGKLENITSIQWRDENSLWFAGWQRLGAIHGVVRLDGGIESLSQEEGIVGTTSFLASILPAADGAGILAVRESEGRAPEIEQRANRANDWRRVSSLNSAAEQNFPGYPDVRAVSWKGPGGLALEGLVLLPKDRANGPLPMIVDIHGGPSWAAKHAFNPGYALPHAAAGYAVFLPNYRGNVGWGQEF